MVEDPKDEKVPEPDKPDPDLKSPIEEGQTPSDEADSKLRSTSNFSRGPEDPDEPDPDLQSIEERAPKDQ